MARVMTLTLLLTLGLTTANAFGFFPGNWVTELLPKSIESKEYVPFSKIVIKEVNQECPPNVSLEMKYDYNIFVFIFGLI